MRYVVYGPGAIGGLVAGRLAQHGHEVAAIARGAHLEVMRREGLTIVDVTGEGVARFEVGATPDELGIREGDVVLLAMKGQDTEAALRALVAVAPPDTPVVCVQNGVANERAALRLFANVYGTCVMCPATHLEPGVVVASSHPVSGILDTGRYPSGVDDVATAVVDAFASSTFVAEARPDVMRWKYQKLLLNLANAVEAAVGMQGRGTELARRAIREALACYEAAGIQCASKDEDRERRGDLLQMHEVGGQPRGGGSSWQSLARGAGTIETDYLNGEIVLLGRLHGVPTPVNEALQRVARDLAARGAPPGSMSMDELGALIGPA